MNFEVVVELKREVLDAEGRAIRESIRRLGYEALKDVKVSKRFLLSIDGERETAKKLAEKIAQEFLANPISENFSLREL
jgi:phosphoribosylformylglycinamidine synthase subunit PurS